MGRKGDIGRSRERIGSECPTEPEDWKQPRMFVVGKVEACLRHVSLIEHGYLDTRVYAG